MRLKDFSLAHALGDHRDNGRDGNAQAADARQAVHLLVVDRYAFVLHAHILADLPRRVMPPDWPLLAA